MKQRRAIPSKTRRGVWGAGLPSAALFCLAVAGAASSASGCSSSACDKGVDEDGIVEVRDIQPVGATYASSDWQGPYFPFPPGKVYQFYHGFGKQPEVVTAYVAFEENPGTVSQAAGDEALLSVDDEKIEVYNNTCQDFWVRVAASSSQ
ncbi:MAG: hypothetical protein H6718_34715 [Polyangiaceae bacterium]|nr:hypothetical protein [Polyangiaceae bacterium]MCB9608122.1 hypothetical protein [Polyangiaceae bacterium]